MIVYVYFYYDIWIDDENVATCKAGGYYNTDGDTTLDELRDKYIPQLLKSLPDGSVLKQATPKSVLEHDKDL